jgi:signal transduction histidine kinase
MGCIAQSKADSLKLKISEIKGSDRASKEKKAKLGLVLLEIQIYDAPLDILLKQIEKLGLLFKELNNEDQYQEVNYQKKGLAYQQHNQFVEAILAYQKFADYLKSKKIKDLNGYFYIDLGNLYLKLNLLKNAERYYKKAIEIFELKKELGGLASAYSSLSIAFTDNKDFDQSVHYARLAFNIRKSENKSPYSLAYQHYSMGSTLRKATKNYQEAANHQKQAGMLLSDTSFVHSELYPELSWVLNATTFELGIIANLENKTDSAYHYLNLLKKEVKKDPEDIQGQLLVAVLATHILNHEKKYKEAIVHNENMLSKYVNYSKHPLYLGLYKEMLSSCEASGDSLRLYKYSYLLTKLEGNLNKDRVKDNMLSMNSLFEEMENQIEIEKKEIALQEKEKDAAREKKIRRNLIFMLIVSIIGLSIILVFWVQLGKKNRLISAYSQKIEAADQTKSMLLSIMGHDLRAPFNAIFSSIQLANFQKPNPELKRELTRISDASRSAFIMLESLLQWVTIQNEEFQIKESSFEIAKLFDDIVNPLDILIKGQEINITHDFQFQTISSDKNMLQIILRNLFYNAIKHCPERSTVMLGTTSEEGNAIIFIENDGQLNEEFIESIQIKNLQKAAIKGSGLGLMLVQFFCDKLSIRFILSNHAKGKVRASLYFPSTLASKFRTGTFENLPISQVKNVLSERDKAELKNWMQKISTLEIYENTEIKQLLSGIGNEDSPILNYWKKNILESVYESDEVKFNQLKDYEFYIENIG